MDPAILAEAAQKRAEAIEARSDRPSQRRCARDQSSGAWAPARARGMTIREAGDSGLLVFEGYATVYERGYEMYDFWGPYTEVVAQGAAATTLARADLDVPLVLQHQSLRRIARTTNGTLTLTEDEHGLRVLADQLDPEDHDVAYVAPKLRAGLLDEMSFMFRITKGQWSPDYTEFRIEEFDIHRGDVAIVGYGANPFTAGSGLRSHDINEFVRSLDDDEVERLRSELLATNPSIGQPVERSKLSRTVLAGDDDEDLLLPLV